MKLLIINGPNINMLGVREPEIYGSKTYEDLEMLISEKCLKCGFACEMFQSNYEGAIVEKIQQAYPDTDGIIINAAAYTHTSVAILDALKSVGVPTVEVHLTDISKREEFRNFSYVSLYAEKVITGKGFDGYTQAIDYFRVKLCQ